MRPVCVDCNVEMHCKRNGAIVRANFQHYYSGDMYRCPVCNKRIIAGFGGSFHSEKIRRIQLAADLLPQDQKCLFES